MGVRAIVGEWYLTSDDTAQFEVVATDDASKSVEIQYFDGSVGEFDLDAWNEMELDRCAPPEDSSGPYDFEFDDIDSTDESATIDFDELAIDGMHIFDDHSFQQEAGIWG
jgi:hypothetical protein